MYILNPDAYHYQLSLFDIGGQRILERNSSSTAEEINLDFIPASSLVYTVVFDDGKMNTGVFIKN